MVDATFIIAVVAFVVGGLSGAFWAFLGFLKSGEAFVGRKFALGIITGVISGVTLVVAQIAGVIAATDLTAQLLALIGLFLAVGGVDTLRTGVSGAIAQRAKEPTQ